MSVRSAQYDVFLCYTWADGKEWSDAMYEALREEGLDVFQDDGSVPEWDEEEMLPSVKAALLGSRFLVPLLTPCFDESDHCWSELHLALSCAKALGGTAMRRVMPLTWKVPPAKVRPKALKKRKLTLEGHSVEELAQHVADTVRHVRETDDRRFGDVLDGGTSWVRSDLPGEFGFVGRRRELWALHDAFQNPDGTLDPGLPAVAVRGLGGSGKTALCRQYARWAAQDHPGGVFVVQLAGSDPSGVHDSDAVHNAFDRALRPIARRLSLPESGVDGEELRVAVARRLEGLPPYLWLVDDLPSSVGLREHPYLLAPSSNGRTLVTSRGTVDGRVRKSVQLSGIGARPGFELLTASHVPAKKDADERNAVRGIVEELREHPLALRITAGLTTADGFTGYRALLADLRKDAEPTLELAAHLGHDLPAETARPLSGVLLRSFHALPAPAVAVLAAASVLAAAPVPRTLLTAAFPVRDEDTASVAAGVADGIDALERRRLLTRDTSAAGEDEADDTLDTTYSVHALVGRAARVLVHDDMRAEASRNALRALADLLGAAEPDAASRTRTLGLLAHVQAVANPAAPEGRDVGMDQWSLVDRSGQLRSHLGDSAGAVEDFRALYASCRASPHCDPYTALRVLVGLGAVLQEDGAFTEALGFQRRTVEELETLHGRDPFGRPHPHTLWAMNNLANTLQELGDFQAARALLRDTHRGWRGHRGPTAPETLTALNNLVIAVGRGPGRYAARVALRIGSFAHERWAATAGPDARGTVDSLFSIGANRLRLGDTEGARTAFEEVWRRRRSHLGDDHPDTLDARENIITARRRATS